MIKVLFVMPITYNAHLPHFRSRFELLSVQMESHVLFTGDPTMDGQRFKGTVLHAQPPQDGSSIFGKLLSTARMIYKGWRIARQEKINAVLAYDPLKLGIVATAIKLLTGCKSVIEINGHVKNAADAESNDGNVKKSRRVLFNMASTITLCLADAVKILNKEQYDEWEHILRRKPCFIFHDFVPTSLFSPGDRDEGYILCVGYPFRRKGVDILLEAYDAVRREFPGMRLVVMGHCREPERSRWQARFDAVPGAELRKPVDYDQMLDVMRGCTVLTQPSRSEAMGRVLIEAMACGKPVIGTSVGGIPDVLGHGEAGLLVRPEDPADLADKLRLILSDQSLRDRLGEAAQARCRTVLSEESYVRSSQALFQALKRKSPAPAATGIVYTIYSGE
ncbi:D-inositol 3-phosphate glycosyltransferase [Fundidesulfovibrio magnetotacticus]|uniref:D-inositol 3-phosphate glycosyltransferase n=1 Tax=Fundidesulfovibrio magnetotacticus TaxID=2730080 RepID=A0A6V8LUA2_9BACT|nr:glycosyltransferase [Fundidesulfovibrio magnetotacticus]GFK93908.1 D-inositol 3-phosphate glycosyltransferase [Fundidesulfovibrio magnetotacticus]